MDIDNYIFGAIDGSKILFRGKDSRGDDVQCIIDDFIPTYYIESKKSIDSPAVGLKGEVLKPVTFSTFSESREWIKEMRDMGVPVHGAISPEVLYFRSLPKKNPVLVSDMTLMVYDIETTVTKGVSVQESAETGKESVTLISAYDTKTKKVHIFSYREFNLSNVESYFDEVTRSYEIEYHNSLDEKSMLLEFLEYYEYVNPHLLSGWNTSGFDNVFMYNKLLNTFGEKTASRLSPFKKVKTKTSIVFGSPAQRVNFLGVADYDYLEIYRQYMYGTIPNYRLDTVANLHTGCAKLKHDGTFYDFYTNHWDKFVAYNIRDTILVLEIDKVLDLLSVACTVAYKCGVSMDGTFGTIKKLDALTYQYACDAGIVIPPEQRSESESYEGGYVSEAKIGKHSAVVSVDAASLYPNTIRECNISPETQIPYDSLPEELQLICDNINVDSLVNKTLDMSALKSTTYTITPAGACYDTSKVGLVPLIMSDLYDGRKVAKKKAQQHEKNAIDFQNEHKGKKLTKEQEEYLRNEERWASVYGNLQMALKILLNSYYGAYGNSNFRYYSLDHARSITLSGQALIRHITDRANDWLKTTFKTDYDFQVYNDTDSCYFSLQPLLDKFPNIVEDDYEKAVQILTKFADGPLSDQIQKISNSYADYRNLPASIIDMKREAISVRGGFWVAKKKYALLVDDMEGIRYSQEGAYLKAMGLEMSKSGKYSDEIRQMLKEIAYAIFNGKESVAQKLVADYKKVFLSKSMEEIGILTNVNEVDKWLDSSGGVKSGTPIGTKAIINHNKYLDIIGDDKSARLQAGDKIYYTPLRSGNPFGMNVIGFIEWGDQFRDIDSWVDRNSLWEKNFISPVETMLDAVKWSAVKKNKLF
jgi:DNA polymerase elongation subunit (family B)